VREPGRPNASTFSGVSGTSNETAASYLIGFARVSTLEQDEGLQRDALAAVGCKQLFVDKASGSLDSRPALDAMLDQLRPGDTVVVWRLDRLGRSLRISITLDVYSHVSPAMQTDAADRVAALILGGQA
jgi:hypothetical protein